MTLSQSPAAKIIRMRKMEVKSDMEDVFKQRTSTSTLFPAASQETMINKQQNLLFPSASVSASMLPTPDKPDLSWLTNKSYTEGTEKKLAEFQKELQKYQNKPSGDDDQEEEIHDSVRTGDDYKRQYISSDDSSDERREKKKKKKHKQKKKQKKEKYQDLEPQDEIKHSEKSEVFSKNKIFLEELGDISQPSAYRLDRQADQNSWTYGSLYKPHIARYKHFSPTCLGSAQTKQVLLFDIKKSSRHKPWDNRYFGKDNRSLIKSIGESVNSDVSQGDLTESYVELKPASLGVDKMSVDVRQRILDESTSAYVKGQAGKEKFHANTDSEPIVKGPLERKVEEFNRKLREEPHNINLWLDFMKFQNVLFSEDNFGGDDSKGKERIKVSSQALLDKKLSILDKAFEANPASIELHLRKLELCSDVWEPARINKELEQLLFVHPANTELWNYYLKYNQSRISIFSVSKVTKLYHKCFKTLFSILEGKVQTHSVPDDLQARVIETFYRYCLFLRDSGYTEKALTSVQAMLEFNLFCPLTLKSASRETRMAAFAEYWDSSSARLGFLGALGWKCWTDHKEHSSAHSALIEENLEEIEESIIEKKLSKCDTWLQIEALRETHHWLPWQPDVSAGQTEEDCEDPERLVMFDDISPVLFTVPEKLHLQLVTFFLVFSGLSFSRNYLVPVKKCWKQFLHNNSSLSDVLVDMFPFSEDSHQIPENLRNFITLLLQQVVAAFEGHEQTIVSLMLIEFHLQMICQGKKELSKGDKKEIRKIVKNILKEERNRNNLLVWHAYVTVERFIGKQGEPDAILETALAMHSGKDISVISEETVGLFSLYRTYCETILQMGAADITTLWERQAAISKEVKQKVVQALYCALENRKYIHNKLDAVPAIAQLKMKSKLKKLMAAAANKLSKASDITSHRTDYMYFLELCVCSGFLEYCSSGLEASRVVYQSARDLLQTSCLKERQLQQMQVDLFREEIRLILYHMASVSTPLSVLRNCLDTALAQHSTEPDFLQLFVDIEKQSRIVGRLHRCFDKLLQSLTSPVPALVAVSSQLEYLTRIQQAGASETDSSSQSGIVHKTRSWLERCLGQANVQHCPLIWRMYFILEKQYDDTSRLKGIFYRSIQQCPGVKELYLEGVQMFGDQLQELVDMMTEKEIRVQIPVEELDILISD